MSRERLATAYDNLAEAYAAVALELRGTDSPEREVPPRPAPAPAQPNTALGKCPKHGIPWTVKEGGVSKAGKSYGPFWKCNEKDASEERGYCAQKPDYGWVKTHPPERALMDEEPPF